jgi:DNA-binding transcriptional MerR regulator
MNERWRLEELVDLAGQALNAAPYEGQSSGRVRDVPDARTIRYYTTLGVLDRPLEMRGRTAYYGRRHLLQIVAVKRLQARGMPLVDIQRNIAGADNSSLKRWAALPAGFWETVLARPDACAIPPTPDDLLASAAPAPGTEGRPRFWATEPALAERDGQAITAAGAVAAKAAMILSLAPGVSLILECRPGQQLDMAALKVVQPAFDELLAALAEAGISEQAARDDRLQTTPNQGDDDGP